MTKTVADIVAEMNKDYQVMRTISIPMLLKDKKVADFKDRNGYNIPGMTFNAEEFIVITSIQNYDNKNFYLWYDSEKQPVKGQQNYIVVPPEFMFNVPDNKNIKAITKKYNEVLRQNVANHLYFSWDIGADPEMFVENDKGENIPAFTFLPSKEKGLAYPPSTSYPFGKAYWDGFQAEFDVTAGTCMDGLTERLKAGLQAILGAARKVDPKAKLSLKSIIDLSPEQLNTAAPEHVAFGCAPSFNIYDLKGVQGEGKEIPYRTAGGHMHFGIGKIKNNDELVRIVKALDAVLGVACVSLFDTIDNPRRRLMYGLAGEYRLPKHGLEYRTLSNAWMCHPLLANIVFDLGRSALMLGKKDFLKFWKGSSVETIDVINTHNVEKAREILKRNEKMFKNIISARYQHELGPTKVELVWNMIINGAGSVIADPADIEKNWGLKNVNSVGYIPGSNVNRATRLFKENPEQFKKKV